MLYDHDYAFELMRDLRSSPSPYIRMGYGDSDEGNKMRWHLEVLEDQGYIRISDYPSSEPNFPFREVRLTYKGIQFLAKAKNAEDLNDVDPDN